MKNKETIYIYLNDEGTDVWRPIEAECIKELIYKIPDTLHVPEDESWEFEPGEYVRCEKKVLSSEKDELVLVATSKVSDIAQQ